MSNELHAYTTTGLTVYAVLLNSTGQVWNGAAFEVIAGGSWTSYDIAMTEAAAGIYLATMPTTTPGAYSYAAYEQAGANPAVTDTLLDTGWINWDGTAEVYKSTVSISATDAAAVASGSLALRTYYTFNQAITSTSTAAINTATKVWLAIKEDDLDADANSVVFVEATDGLTYLAGVAYATTTDGTLTVTGSSGAWIITTMLEEAATALLYSYAGGIFVAEIKALIAGDTVNIWNGICDISQGVVKAYV